MKDRQRRANIRVVTAVHPHRAGFDVKRWIERLPQLVSALDHLHVDAIGAVDRADDARFAAGAGARISRTPGIDQSDIRAGIAELQRGPTAKRSRADDGDARVRVGVRAAGNPAKRDRRHARRQERSPANQYVTRVLIPNVRG